MKKTKWPRTFEENSVGFILALSFLIALAIFVTLLYLELTPVFILHKLFGGVGFYIGFIVTLFSLHAVVSFVLAWGFHFSHRQFKMLCKFMLGSNVGLPLALMAYGYVILGPMISIIRELRGVGILLVALMNVSLFGLVVILRKFWGRRFREWVRIKYVPEKASLEVAEKHLREGKTRLEKGLFEGASQEFHAAALVFLRLEDWPKAAENYQMAAQTLSNESNPDFGFGIAWFYALSASSHLLSGNTEKAKEALELGKETLRTRRIDKKAEEKVSLILEFLTAISSNKVQQASEIWQNLERRAGKWGYPVVEETMLLLKKNRALLDDVKPQKK